jgi:hypothetical protein
VQLEDRTTPSTVSTIASNFDRVAIPTGDTIWFNSALEATNLPRNTPVTIHVVGGSIDFTAGGQAYHVAVPDSVIVLTPGATTSTATFDSANNAWDVSAPTRNTGDVFMTGVEAPVSTALPAGIRNVKWTESFWSDTANVRVDWHWSAAVYKNLSSDYNSLGVKPVDDRNLSAVRNRDEAGTPEAFKSSVVAGATGRGGRNFTGDQSRDARVRVGQGTGQGSNPTTLSGNVYVDTNFNNAPDPGEGVGGAIVTLTGVDKNGGTVSQTLTTAADGTYQFTGLSAGTYSISVTAGSLMQGPVSVGTVGGSPDGAVGTDGMSVDTIVLSDGNQGVGYNFAEFPVA